MKLEIKKGAMKNLDELEKLYDDLNDALSEGINYPGWKKGIYPIREDALKGLENGDLFIAEFEGKIVGSIILSHEPEGGYENVQWHIDAEYDDIFVIRTFVVHPDYFKNNVGYSLMKFAEEEARRCNIKSIRLDVYENNMPAIKLYEKMGYKYLDSIDLGLGQYGLDWFKIYEKVI